MVNQVILVGRCGRDAEVKYTQSGVPVADFSIATNKRWKDKSGESKDITTWHNIVIWGKFAEVIGPRIKKGLQIYVEGEITNRKWEDKNGAKRSTTEIVAGKTLILGDREQVSSEPSGNKSQIPEDFFG